MDAIVIGLGGMGSAAAYHLARRGAKVLGLEQYPFVHDRGSSHGQTRIIRTAYHEHPNYIPLVRRAFENWHDLEQTTGQHLLTKCDCLTMGPPDGEMIAGLNLAATRLAPGAVSNLDAKELQRLYPFRVPENFEGRLEHEAGILFVENCVRTYQDAAQAHGAELHCEEPVLEWKALGDGVEVTTTKAKYHAAKVIITAGAWATKLLADLGIQFTVMRQVMLWFEPRQPEAFRRDRFPIFLIESPQGDFYGMPMINGRGVKIARHYGAPELDSPDGIDWAANARDTEPVQQFIDEYFPNQFTKIHARQVCMYTLSPDRHFVIDKHPQHANVCVAAGFSGHGFKFASVVGETLADLAIEGKTNQPIEMFAATRFMQRMPSLGR